MNEKLLKELVLQHYNGLCTSEELVDAVYRIAGFARKGAPGMVVIDGKIQPQTGGPDGNQTR